MQRFQPGDRVVLAPNDTFKLPSRTATVEEYEPMGGKDFYLVRVDTIFERGESWIQQVEPADMYLQCLDDLIAIRDLCAQPEPFTVEQAEQVRQLAAPLWYAGLNVVGLVHALRTCGCTLTSDHGHENGCRFAAQF